PAETLARTGPHPIARAASFLLLADSRASFEIEGERPPRNRLERWGRAVLQAGKSPLSLDELNRLHGVLIEDTRFIKAGLRPDGVFLGERDHNGDPLPEFIGARPGDLANLVAGILAVNERMRERSNRICRMKSTCCAARTRRRAASWRSLTCPTVLRRTSSCSCARMGGRSRPGVARTSLLR